MPKQQNKLPTRGIAAAAAIYIGKTPEQLGDMAKSLNVPEVISTHGQAAQIGAAIMASATQGKTSSKQIENKGQGHSI